MIKKLVRQMLAAQTVSALTVSLCLLIDNIMIGRFLGVNALAAYGLANPVLLVIGALGSMLSAGVQVACSKSLGKGSQKETNAGYSSAILIAAVISIAFVLVVVLFREPLAGLLGAKTQEVLSDTSNYMAGFIIGAPASMGALILVPFLQMAGQSNLLIAAVLGMTVADVGFDLLNVVVFHGGMFGMGLASSISYYFALLIGGWYFFSRKCVFRFSFRLIVWKKIKELLAGGVPTVVGMVASVFLVFVMNKILLRAGGHNPVAAFAVINTIGSACNCISTGSGGVSLTLSGILFHEEDGTGLKALLKLMIRYAAIMGAAATILLLICAPYFVSLFIPDPGETRTMAVTGLRLFSAGLIPCCVNNALRSIYQGTGRIRTMEVISILENAVLPALAALILSRPFGVSGAWFYMLAGEVLTLLGIFGYVGLKNGRFPKGAGDILFLPKHFGVPEKDLLEESPRSLTEVVDFSRKAERFCLEHGQSAEMSNHLALCIEEMGSNIVNHGFESEEKNHLSIRIQSKEERWVLRFRDDCRAFNPLEYIAQGNDSIGIRLVTKMADDARYTYSLNLNNLTLVLLKNR